MQLFVRSTVGRTLALEVERDATVCPHIHQPLSAAAGNCACIPALRGRSAVPAARSEPRAMLLCRCVR